MKRRRRSRGRTVAAKPRHAAIDGLDYFRAITEVRKKLAGTELLTGEVWPVEKEEKEERDFNAITYLQMSSRIIGSDVESSAPIGLMALSGEGELPTLLSSRLENDGEKSVLVGETENGQVEIAVDFSSLGGMSPEKKAELFASVDSSRIVPLGDSITVYNACSTALLTGGHRLLVAQDDVALVDKAFWKKLIIVGMETIGDVNEKASEEFALSPNGILLRLRRMAEKLGSALKEDPLRVIQILIASAAAQARLEKDMRWFMERVKTDDDELLAGMVGYTLLARRGVDPLMFIGGARSLAENPQFYHEYRKPGERMFESRGLTQLLYESFVVVGEGIKQEAEGPMPFERAQEYARALQFGREMQEIMSRRDVFINLLKTGNPQPQDDS